ncbi:MAG: FkbM family methyltransferase [Acidobacteria bacterium]|uniref:FkbM family methyltransferase n=1 Tax=Candidatus Polarisedimenticola svalbardensis TaxID=2886004 RepID=A0A8J7CD12_9BACT|nr:FkbM family methyltransferase [Candidatus Polarisedimenticola svalbardensis]
MNRIRWIVRQIQFLLWRVRNHLNPPTPWDGNHHPAILRIEPWRGEADGEFCVDFLGVRTDPGFRSFFKPTPKGNLETSHPVPDQTYFEYICLLDSIAAAAGPVYTVLELGAGYGYWLVSASRALSLRPDLTPRMVGVEMEATRFRRMQEHFRNNGLNPEAHTLLSGAISDHDGTASYRVDENEGEDYGLSLDRLHSAKKVVPVSCMRLGPILNQQDQVDLLHMDLQGEELKVIRDARAEINSRVRHLIIGTHSVSIHRGIRKLLLEDGWCLRFDYMGKGERRTEFGTILFVDGLLAAQRPAL